MADAARTATIATKKTGRLSPTSDVSISPFRFRTDGSNDLASPNLWQDEARRLRALPKKDITFPRSALSHVVLQETLKV